MWAAIRSDLQEFALGVADETDQVIATTSASPAKGGPPAVNDEGDVVEGDFAATGVVSSAQDEIDRRQEDPDTYTAPLDESDPDVQAFLDDFNIDDKTQEIAELLKDNPDTIQEHFEHLVPTEISYALFWQRYFYRCGDEDRIARHWQEEREARRQARADAISGGIASVTNLFGGALSAVSQSLEKADSRDAVPVSPFIPTGSESSKPAPTGGGMNLFGSGGRPPFVMNTAVDEDGDDDEEEEELGWDDDDDDDFDDDEVEEQEDDDEVNIMDQSEEITFTGNNEAMNKLSEQLAQALSERDACKETIEMQSKEIARMKDGQPVSDSDKEVEKLKMKLFEKDAELGALKASLEDTHEDDADDGAKEKSAKKDSAQLDSLTEDVRRLTEDVKRLTEEVTESQAKLATQTEATAEAQAELAQVREAASASQDVLQSSLDTALAEADALRVALASSNGSESEALEALQGQVALGLTQIGTLSDELKEVKDELETTKTTSMETEDAMVALQMKMVKVQGELMEARETAAVVEEAAAEAEQSSAGAEEAIEAAKAEAAAAKKELEQVKEEAEKVAAAAKEEAAAAKEEAAAAKEAAKEASAAKEQAEKIKDQAEKEAATAKEEAEKIRDQAEKEAAAAKEEAEKVKEQAEKEAAAAKAQAEKAQKEAAEAKEAAAASGSVDPKEVGGMSEEDRSSPSSESTGVKVEPPVATTSPALAADIGDDEEDEWGDAWSEEEDE